MKILIIEDDQSNSKILSRMLESYGPITVAENGKDGLEFFRTAMIDNTPFSLVFLDIMLPEIDGQEVLKGIRQFEHDRKIYGYDCVKVIMTSALDDSKNIMQAFRSQCEGYLVKPIQKGKLYKEIARLFNEAKC